MPKAAVAPRAGCPGTTAKRWAEPRESRPGTAAATGSPPYADFSRPPEGHRLLGARISNFSGRVRSAILFCRCSCLVLPLLISGRGDRITSTLTRGDQVDGDCAKLSTLFRSRCRFRERVLTASEINDESREASSVFLPHDHRQAVGYALPDRAILWRAVVIADAVVRGVPLSRDLDLYGVPGGYRAPR